MTNLCYIPVDASTGKRITDECQKKGLTVNDYLLSLMAREEPKKTDTVNDLIRALWALTKQIQKMKKTGK